MMSTIVDSVVLIDIFVDDPVWANWSTKLLLVASKDGPLVINPIIYAEVAATFEEEHELEAALPKNRFNREDIPYPAASSPERRITNIDAGAASEIGHCRIFSSGRMHS